MGRESAGQRAQIATETGDLAGRSFRSQPLSRFVGSLLRPYD